MNLEEAKAEEWIPVTERSPQFRDMYICHLDTGENSHAWNTEILIFGFEEGWKRFEGNKSVSIELPWRVTHWMPLPPRPLINPEPEKEEECAKCKPLARCPECFAKLRSKSPARKTEGLTREEAIEAYEAGATIRHPKQFGYYSDVSLRISQFSDGFTATYREAPKPEEKKEELKTFGGKMFAMLDNLPEAPKPEPIELGDALEQAIAAPYFHETVAIKSDLDWERRVARAIIARVLEIVGERR